MTPSTAPATAADRSAGRSPSRSASGHITNRQDLLFWGTFAALVGATLVVVMVPAIHGHEVAPAIDLVLDTIAALVSITVAALAWLRSREQHWSHLVYSAAAFLALGVAYGAAVVVSLGRDA